MKHFTLFATFCVSIAPSSLSDSSLLVVGGPRESNSRVTSSQPLVDQRNAEHTDSIPVRRKRSVFHLFNMMTCATTCNPLNYKGYGCYCGFLGSGVVVDGIDKCCARHDRCYFKSRCPLILTYFASYLWTCQHQRPRCVTTKRPSGAVDSCGHQLCECDREFVECLKQYPCPRSRAICTTSPWRNSIFLGKWGREASILLQTLL